MGETFRAMKTKTPALHLSQRKPRWQSVYRPLYLGLAIAALGGVQGCDSNAFVPSRPPELTSSPRSTTVASKSASSVAAPAPSSPGEVPLAKSGARARMIELILVQPASLDQSYLEQIIRRDAGMSRCAFRTVSPTDDKALSAAQLASEIRTAANRSTGALILEPIDAPEVREALHEAESKGLKIVVLDAPVPTTSPGKHYPYVTYQGFTEAAKQLVEAVASDAKKMRVPADGTTLVIENRDTDAYSKTRLESLTGALKAAGQAFDTVSFSGEVTGATDVILEYLKTHPKVAIILADHDYGVAGAYNAREQWAKSHTSTFAVAGYHACDGRLTPPLKIRVQGLIDRSVEGFARKATQVALDLMDAKAVPERSEVKVRLVHDNPPYVAPPMADSGKEKSAQSIEKERLRQHPRVGSGVEPKPAP